jgi:hypothetical protein
VGGLGYFYDFAGLNAGGTDAHALGTAVNLGLDGLKVDVPTTTGLVVRVRDVVSELRAFAAEITFGCHGPGAPNLYVANCDAEELPSADALKLLWEDREEMVGTSGFEPLTSTVSR